MREGVSDRRWLGGSEWSATAATDVGPSDAMTYGTSSVIDCVAAVVVVVVGWTTTRIDYDTKSNVGSLLHRWIVGSLDRGIVGSLDRWIVGSLDRWIVGSLDRWIVGSLDRSIARSLASLASRDRWHRWHRWIDSGRALQSTCRCAKWLWCPPTVYSAKNKKVNK